MPKSPSNKRRSAGTAVIEINPDALFGWPLPRSEQGSENEERGRVLVIGGAVSMPGAVVLSATAVLRAGAGKLQIGTCATIATAVGLAVPESLVYALPETGDGGIDPGAAAQLGPQLSHLDTVLIGPGMVNPAATIDLTWRLVDAAAQVVMVLDAGALKCVTERRDCLHALGGNVILTPHAGEMAGMLSIDKAEVEREPLRIARQAAAELRAVIALKGATTYVATPDGTTYRYTSQTIGLAAPGSGDTLAGVIAGLVARGAAPAQAAIWGVYLHAGAGERLTKRVGRLGFLARELLAEIPIVMAEFDH